MIDAALFQARCLVRQGEDAAARDAYLLLLRHDPTNLTVLTELGALTHDGGYLSAAREAYRQAVQLHPDSLVARIGYGDVLRAMGDPAAACLQYRSAWSVEPDEPRVHQGLARALTELGEAAGAHWQKGFAGHAVVKRRYRGSGQGIGLLLLVAAVGGNLPTQSWIDDRVYAVTAIYADFFDPAEALPAHALIVNAIGDADRCAMALAGAERIIARSNAPAINLPALVNATGREQNARRLATIPAVTAPRISRLSRAELRFPLLLRAPGYHTGQHFLRVDTAEALADAVASLPDEDPLVIDYHDARGPDGMARKYRVMLIDGALYPLHLAISPDWKVHYFTAAMAAEAAFRDEERRFLEDMPGVLGKPAMRALASVQTLLGLDYAGIDFALTADGSVLVFEANATMVINPPEPDPMWDYRRAAAAAALAAAGMMLANRVRSSPF